MTLALKLTFTQKSLICPVQSAGPEFRTDIFPVRSRIPDRDKLVRSNSPEMQLTLEPVYSTQKFWWEPGDTAFKSFREEHEKLVQFH